MCKVVCRGCRTGIGGIVMQLKVSYYEFDINNNDLMWSKIMKETKVYVDELPKSCDKCPSSDKKAI